jgi:hypothetical protein
MARHGDTGPYAARNVKCITQSANAREQPKHKRGAKLTEDQVKFIYHSVWDGGKGNSRAVLAKQFGVAKDTIKAIHKKWAWRSVTDLLD